MKSGERRSKETENGRKRYRKRENKTEKKLNKKRRKDKNRIRGHRQMGSLLKR